MDPQFHGFLNPSNEYQFGNQLPAAEFSEVRRFGITYPDQNGQGNQNFCVNDGIVPSSFADIDEDCDFPDEALRYIDKMLMEEDVEDKSQESLDLIAKEKSFYEVLGEKYPPSQQPESALISQNGGSPDNYFYHSTTSSSNGSGYLIDIIDPSYNSRISSSNSSSIVDGLSDSPVSPFQICDVYTESQSVWNFNKGVEEASKFLPSTNNFLVNVDLDGLSSRDPIRQSDDDSLILEKKEKGESSLPESRCKKTNHHTLEVDFEEERSSKLPVIYKDCDVLCEEFDNVLLNSMGEGRKRFAAYRADLQSATNKGEPKEFNCGKGWGKKKPKRKKEVIDLRTFLITCAQAIAADDRQTSNELLKQIRRHSSPLGDGNQRLAHYFADGFEARLAGTGSKIHKSLLNKRTTAADYLKAYYTYLASAPFTKISNFVSNKTIMDRGQKAMRIHIIDFGILYGFQWPTFIQRISQREGGPPKVRITGVDFPQPGFRPAERVEDTGRRLARYAETFYVPFEFNAVAQNWDTIKLEDLKLEEGEFVVVTCLYRARNLLDETIAPKSPRTAVLDLIRRINPAVFIHGIVNGAYSAPFFVTRFREILFHFSALFDMLENNVPRDKPERLLIERDIFGREALNVIACEGWERVERAETYKQWQIRDLKAGFLQVPFDKEVMSTAKYKVRSFFHKEFVIDEDGHWLLLGWKGRIICAISCWKPV